MDRRGMHDNSRPGSMPESVCGSCSISVSVPNTMFLGIAAASAPSGVSSSPLSTRAPCPKPTLSTPPVPLAQTASLGAASAHKTRSSCNELVSSSPSTTSVCSTGCRASSASGSTRSLHTATAATLLTYSERSRNALLTSSVQLLKGQSAPGSDAASIDHATSFANEHHSTTLTATQGSIDLAAAGMHTLIASKISACGMSDAGVPACTAQSEAGTPTSTLAFTGNSPSSSTSAQDSSTHVFAMDHQSVNPKVVAAAGPTSSQPCSCSHAEALGLPPVAVQAHFEDLIGVLIDAGLPAMLENKETIAAMRLGCGHRMADALLQEHGVLRVVLPSATEGSHMLPKPSQLAKLHGHKLRASAAMQLVCGGRMPSSTSLVPHRTMTLSDKQYLAGYAPSLCSALRAGAGACMASTSLMISVPPLPGAHPFQYRDVVAYERVAEAIPALLALLPSLNHVRIALPSYCWHGNVRIMLQALEACPRLHTLELMMQGSFDTQTLAPLKCQSHLRVLVLDDIFGTFLLHWGDRQLFDTLQVLSCKRVRPDVTGLQLSSLHTLAAPPSTQASTHAAACRVRNSSQGGIPQGHGRWQVDTEPCCIKMELLTEFPALQYMRHVEVEVGSPWEPDLAVSQLEVKLAGCAPGWALAVEFVKSSSRSDFGWSRRIPPGGLPAVQNLAVHIKACWPYSELTTPQQRGLEELLAALPGLRQLAVCSHDLPGSSLAACVEAAGIAVRQQLAWQHGHAQQGEEAVGDEVAQAARPGSRGCLEAVYLCVGSCYQPLQRKALLVGECTAVIPALHGLAGLCAQVHSAGPEAVAKTGGVYQTAEHPALRVHVAGVDDNVLAACNAQLVAAAVPHRMLAW